MPVQDSPRRVIGRSPRARRVALGLRVASLGLILSAFIFQPDATQETYAFMLCCIGSFIAVLGVATEIKIQRQLHLANFGTVAEARVIERFKSDDRECARYAFSDAAGMSVEKVITIDDVEAACVQVCSRMLVVFDPQRPSHNQPVDSLWAANLMSEPRFGEDGKPVPKLA